MTLTCDRARTLPARSRKARLRAMHDGREFFEDSLARTRDTQDFTSSTVPPPRLPA